MVRENLPNFTHLTCAYLYIVPMLPQFHWSGIVGASRNLGPDTRPALDAGNTVSGGDGWEVVLKGALLMGAPKGHLDI